jgi:hypothetical protein
VWRCLRVGSVLTGVLGDCVDPPPPGWSMRERSQGVEIERGAGVAHVSGRAVDRLYEWTCIEGVPR